LYFPLLPKLQLGKVKYGVAASQAGAWEAEKKRGYGFPSWSLGSRNNTVLRLPKPELGKQK